LRHSLRAAGIKLPEGLSAFNDLVAPLTLLVPVIGLSSCWVLLDEALHPSQILGAAVVMLGLVVNVFGQNLITRLRAA